MIGRIILQGLGSTVAQADIGERAERMVADFSKVQPVKEYIAALGVKMLALFDVLKRRESQWRALIAEIGLEIKAIKPFTPFGDGVMGVAKP
ncbi:hypothetical protein N7508_010185 [Penicillium antarcticum]|uniref:uncharacterized protein n=1 Tax=Penicillium antarcticum TaxID=416450 RepID=UPI00239CE6CF|nr:uncharacterized protein N7508_010185 [Penicillium antarcticum]KAJ5295364.1 hypothetical protein N7508_010185 [Penicillium antarcticum]